MQSVLPGNEALIESSRSPTGGSCAHASHRPGIEHLKLVDLPVPLPGRAKYRYASRPRPQLPRSAAYAKRQSGRKSPLCAAFLRVRRGHACGSGVTRFKNGDRVMPAFFQNWFSGPIPSQESVRALGGILEGVACEFACFPELAVAKAPDALGDVEAAGLPCAALTAWNALFVAHSTKPGDVVLLLGTGGVSIAGLQLAKAAGAIVIITSSSETKLRRARALGADYTINYMTTPSWETRHAL